MRQHIRKVGAALLCVGLVSSAAAEVIELKLAPDSVAERRLTVAAGKFIGVVHAIAARPCCRLAIQGRCNLLTSTSTIT